MSITLRIPAAAAPDRKSSLARTVPVRIPSDLYLADDADMPEVVTIVENKAKDHRLPALFPTGARRTEFSPTRILRRGTGTSTYPAKQFTIEHPAAVAPMQRFVAVAEGKRGMLVSLRSPGIRVDADRRGRSP